MMRQGRNISLFFCYIFILQVVTWAVPPFLWYGTYSVENYVGNGCPCDTVQINGQWGLLCNQNLYYTHEEAAAFNSAIVSLGISNSNYRYNRQDDAVTAARWTGTSAEINYVDFLFYSGHGSGFGPRIGCDATHTVTCYDIRFQGPGGYLKWVQGSACEWFCHPDYANGVGEFSRWNDCFQGVHTVQGHRAVTWDISNPQPLFNDFWNDWVNAGESIDEAWKSAQVEFVYANGAHPGLQPATMAATSTYAEETWASAGSDVAPTGAQWLSWRTVGTPEYR
jgi:hypothetical protein